MAYTRARVIREMIQYFDNDDRRIEHAMRVFFHAERLAMEAADCDSDVLTAVALLHDIGIKQSEATLGYNNAKTQEEYGPPVAEQLLQSIQFPAEKIEKVKDIIGNHHSRSRFDYPELEILKQADRIVNLVEKV